MLTVKLPNGTIKAMTIKIPLIYSETLSYENIIKKNEYVTTDKIYKL